jgi:hypothetical protein
VQVVFLLFGFACYLFVIHTRAMGIFFFIILIFKHIIEMKAKRQLEMENEEFRTRERQREAHGTDRIAQERQHAQLEQARQSSTKLWRKPLHWPRRAYSRVRSKTNKLQIISPVRRTKLGKRVRNFGRSKPRPKRRQRRSREERERCSLAEVLLFYGCLFLLFGI